ncbi:hypothetical protein HDC94_001354 [Leifsonia sp. AK011]|nr:hypothetical protein [Leifsonia sp. AK011]
MRKSGNVGRALAIPLSLIVLFLIAGGIETWYTARSLTVVVLAVTCLASLYFLVRSFFIGVWVSDDQAKFVGWFSTVRLARSSIRHFSSVPYSGMLFASRGWWSGMISVSRDGGRTFSVPSSLSGSKSIRDQVAELNAWLRNASVS